MEMLTPDVDSKRFGSELLEDSFMNKLVGIGDDTDSYNVCKKLS
jgi:hypothetical protein